MQFCVCMCVYCILSVCVCVCVSVCLCVDDGVRIMPDLLLRSLDRVAIATMVTVGLQSIEITLTKKRTDLKIT